MYTLHFRSRQSKYYLKQQTKQEEYQVCCMLREEGKNLSAFHWREGLRQLRWQAIKQGKWSLKNNIHRQDRTGKAKSIYFSGSSNNCSLAGIEQRKTKQQVSCENNDMDTSLCVSLFPMNLHKAQTDGQLMAPNRRLLFPEAQKIMPLPT